MNNKQDILFAKTRASHNVSFMLIPKVSNGKKEKIDRFYKNILYNRIFKMTVLDCNNLLILMSVLKWST